MVSRNVLNNLISGLFFVSCVLFFTAPCYAQSNSGLRVAPAVQEVTMRAGEKSKDVSITYTNNTSSELGLSLSTMDFKQSDDLGRIGLLSESSGYSYSLSSFLSLQSNELRIVPGESKQIVVRIENRDDVSPGGHYAAVLAKVQTDRKQGATSISPSLSSLLLVNKQGGERYNLSLKSVGWPDSPVVFSIPQRSEYLFQNEGNTHLVPRGRVDVLDMFERPIAKGVVNESSARIFPESRRYISVQYYQQKWVLPVSVLMITAKGNDSLQKTGYSHRDMVLYIHPAVLLLLLAVVGAVMWLYRYRRGQK